MFDFGQLLVSYRKRQPEMTQAELAARLGVSRGTIANWECGKHLPRPGNIDLLYGLEDVLGLSHAELDRLLRAARLPLTYKTPEAELNLPAEAKEELGAIVAGVDRIESTVGEILERAEGSPSTTGVILKDVRVGGNLTISGITVTYKASARARQSQERRRDFYRHIALPPNYVPRPELLAEVRTQLLTDTSSLALTSAILVPTQTTALHGMGGIGKSVVARALCEDPAVQAAFPDGILWTTLGKTPDLIRCLREWIDVLGGMISETAPTVERLSGILADLLRERACLLIVDDAWQRTHVEPFRVGGPRCRLLITTRDRAIPEASGAAVYAVPVMAPAEAVTLKEGANLPGFRYLFDQVLPRLHWELTCRRHLLSMPSEWSEVNDYLLKLNADMKNELRLKTYLPLASKPLPTISPVAQEIERDPFVSSIHHVILQIMGRSYGGDSASAQIAVAGRQSREIHNILAYLDRAQMPLILLGEAGGGKTMTLQEVAVQLADRGIHRVFPKVPIYLRLGDFHAVNKVGADDVREFVWRSVPFSVRSRLEELERSGRLVIFFDGMDEMSRERYSEHTEALSVFADQTQAKTLFSCRITDFNPRFRHQRLVILPFNRDQVIQYLRIYIQDFPMVIDGQYWTLKQLTRHILLGELPIEANNPFVLWLLCLYLQDKGTWPDSRVALLEYYNEQNYHRKDGERRSEEPPFPEIQRAFQEWARFAFAATVFNLGGIIPVAVLEEGSEAASVQEMIRVGRRCGVLAESRETFGEPLVRFAHHRFQEFFAARHIHVAQPPLHWLNLLDAPRWQETMLNLILMGGSEPLVRTFSDSMIELTQTCRSVIAQKEELSKGSDAPNENKGKSHEKPPSQENGERSEQPAAASLAEHEAVLADRVEVASRVMRETVASAPDVREILMPPFREAVSVLAEHGNPISQVKVMRACQNVPEIDFIEALRKPLNSSVNWVRNQALMLITSGSTSERAIGSDIATEIGYDLANGLLPRRFSTYCKAIVTTRDWRSWSAFASGILVYLTYLGWLVFAATFLYFCIRSAGDATWFGLSDFSVLNYRTSIVIFGIGLAVAVAVGLRNEPARIWLVVPASAMGLGFFMPVLYRLWSGSWVELVVHLAVLVFFGYYVVYSVCMLIAAPVQFGVLVIYLLLTLHLRKHGHAMKTFLLGAWKSGRYSAKRLLLGLVLAFWWLIIWLFAPTASSGLNPVLSGLGVIVGFLVLIVVASTVVQIGQWLMHIARTCVRNGWDTVFGEKPSSTLEVLGGLGVLAFLVLLGWAVGHWPVVFVILICVAVMIGIVIYLRASRRAMTLLLGIRVLIGVPLLACIGGLLVYGLVLLSESSLIARVRPFIVGVLTVGALGGLGFVVVRNAHSIRVYLTKGIPHRIVRFLLLFGLAIAGAVGLIYLLPHLWKMITDHWAQIVPVAARMLAVATIPALLLLALADLRPWTMLTPIVLGGRRPFSGGTRTLSEWRQLVKQADSEKQKKLLQRTDPQDLALTADQFLDALKDIEPMIMSEPAQSVYWERRDRFEEALKQERRG